MSHKKITSLQDIEKLQQQLLSRQQSCKAKVLVCMTGCRALGAQDVCTEFRRQLKGLSLDEQVIVVETGCIGMCARAPVVLIEPYEYFYGGVTPEDVEEIISTTIQKSKPLNRLAVTQDGKPVVKVSDIDFYKRQDRKVLENCGRIDPRSIENAIERGGYVTAVRTLTEKQPQQIIDEVTDSGLRGRGGAGFPTGVKWNFARKSTGEEKYLICNADEGDPGAFMDRALLEGDPHRVIEGMIIAAYAIGAGHGFIYVRAEYPIAVEHINIALEQARALGLLGDNIAGTGFGFDIEVRMGAGAFVCGEETALIASLEGKRGMPTTRPPFPAVKGYQGKPTNINNVETFANVPIVLKDGAKNYSKIGTAKSKGTKIFALAGKVNNTGLVEVPMGTTLREIIFYIGGGIPKGRKFKAAQMGGPSGGCIPAKYLDSGIDYDSVQQFGAIMGSGGLIVMDENTCMVDIARYFLEFVQSESCGNCTPCSMAVDISKASLCGLGQTAPNPVLSTLRNFKDEYVRHIVDKKCPAGICTNLLTYEILEVCTGCGACRKVCPVGAISGEKKEQHVIDQNKCIKCDQCFDACKFQAITK